MEISPPNNSSEPRFSRAVSLLREVADILDVNNSEKPSSLRQQATRNRSTLSSFSQSLIDEPEPQPSTSRQLNNNTPSRVSTASGTSRGDKVQNNGQSNILENFRSLFSPYSREPPKAKRARTSSCGSRLYKVKETWTHEFFCLANTKCSTVPSRALKFQLQLAALGRKKIVFGWKDNPFQVKAKLEEVFPKLVNGGGFELLRSGVPVQSLVVISPPAAGYSVPFLRDVSGLGQAIAYVRPLQRDLEMSIEVSASDQVTCTVLTFNISAGCLAYLGHMPTRLSAH